MLTKVTECDKKTIYIQNRLIMITMRMQNSISTTDAPYVINIPIYISAPVTYTLVK